MFDFDSKLLTVDGFDLFTALAQSNVLLGHSRLQC